MLGKVLVSSSEFKINNATNDTELISDSAGTKVLFDVSCGSSVVAIEVQSLTDTTAWSDVTNLHTAANVNCSASGTASFEVPLDFIAPFAAEPTTVGEQRENFKLRWAVKNKVGEISYSYKDLTAVIQAPEVTLQAGPVNIANQSAYVVSGTCSLSGAPVVISGFFSGQTTCVAGVYTYTEDLSGMGSPTTIQVTARHKTAATPRAIGEDSETVSYDVIAPVVSLATPASSPAITTLNHTPGAPISFTGNCDEPGGTLTFTVEGAVAKTALCPASGTYSEDITIADGDAIGLAVLLTDAVGNSTTVNRTILKDTVAPLPFSIAGVTAVGEAVTQISNVVTSLSLMVHFSPIESGVDYKVEVKRASDSVLKCDTVVSGVAEANFASCGLVHNENYKIYITAMDSNGNLTSASNNGTGNGTFSVSYVAPVLQAVTSSTADGAYNSSSPSVNVTLTFNKNVTWLSTNPVIALNLASGSGTATYVSGKNTKVLTFSYGIQVGHNATQLTTNSISAGIVDERNPTLTANTSAMSAGLSSRNIAIDTTPPALTLTLGESLYYHVSPVLTYSYGGADAAAKKIELLQGTTVMQELTLPNTQFTGLNLLPGTVYTIKLTANDAVGNIAELSQNFTGFQCPNNFVYIYDSVQNNRPFCMASAEAGTISGSTPAFDGALPASSISYNSAKAYCTDMGYHLPSTSEWNTTAKLIGSIPTNWTTGITSGIGQGNLIQGHVDDSVAKPLNKVTPCDHALCGQAGGDNYRRYHDLPRSQKIYDLGGNLAEYTEDFDTTTYATTSGYIYNLRADVLGTTYGTQQYCSNSVVGYCGYGYADFGFASNPAVVLRGGDFDSANKGGVFSVFGAGSPANEYSVTFRCTYRP